MNKVASSIVLAVVIALGLPLGIWLERQENFTWVNRLAVPRLEPSISRHTPGNTDGTFLPPVIQKNTTFSSADNPIIIPGTTTVAAGTTLTFEEGTNIYVHEYGALVVEGTLIMNGRATNHVVITTNETNPANQIWAGIMTGAGGQSDIQYTRLAYASPGLSCLTGATVNAHHTTITYGNLGLFAMGNTCTLTNSVVKNVRDGIATINSEPATAGTVIHASRDQFRNFTP